MVKDLDKRKGKGTARQWLQALPMLFSRKTIDRVFNHCQSF
jgi:hypothetical protein